MSNRQLVLQVYLSFPTYALLALEKSSATKDITKSVLVALLIFLAANNNLSLSSSAANENYYNLEI